MLTQVVLLPTPPFALATANTRWTLMREGGSGGGEKDGGFRGRRARARDAREDAVGEGWETARAAGHGDGEAGSAVGTVGSVRVVWCYKRKVCRSRASYGPSYVSLVPRAPSYLMRVGYRLARWTSARVSAFHRA